MIKIGRSVGPVEEGNVYSGGSSDAVTKLFNAKGKDIMYIGDHIFGDILKSKKENGWRTFLVVPELSQELHIWSDNRDVYDKVRALDDVISEAYQNLDSSSKDVVDIRNIKKEFREAVHQQDMQYGMFGSMFRLVKKPLGTVKIAHLGQKSVSFQDSTIERLNSGNFWIHPSKSILKAHFVWL